MVLSIHQPNFFPWYPFFQKIVHSDIFVFLEHCQFEKNNFQNRFKLNEKWYTMSVNSGISQILEKNYVNYEKDWSKIKFNLKNYGTILDEFDDCISNSLSMTNKNIVHKIVGMLNISTSIVEDYPTNLKSTERLVDICKRYGATTYLSGIGGKKYLDESIFIKNGIKIEYQKECELYKIPIIDKLSEI